MHLKWIEDFIAYAETRSFTRAAQQRNVTHPAFGRRIKALEGWVGVPLIDRGSFPSTLTPEGERFLEVATLVAGELTDVRSDLRRRRTRDGQVATFATGRTLARTLFPILHAKLGLARPKAQLRLLTTTVHDGLIMLADDAVDLLMCYAGQGASIDVDEAEYERALIASEALVAVATAEFSGSMPALDKGRTPVRILAYSDHMALGRVMRGAIARSPLNGRSDVVFETDMAEALHDAALQGLGLAWLPQRLVAADIDAGRLVRIDTPVGDIPLEIRFYRKRRNRGRAVQAVWQGFLEAAAGL